MLLLTEGNKMKYKCFNCGKSFKAQYELLLHYDFHAGEPTVRGMGCVCGEIYDIRAGECFLCGKVYESEWVTR